MTQIKNILNDIFFFLQILIYWPIALLFLKPLWWIDKKTGAGYFKFIDRLIKKIAGE
jgi:hypothetical protein